MTLDLRPEWLIDADGKPDPYGVRTALAERKRARMLGYARGYLRGRR